MHLFARTSFVSPLLYCPHPRELSPSLHLGDTGLRTRPRPLHLPPPASLPPLSLSSPAVFIASQTRPVRQAVGAQKHRIGAGTLPKQHQFLTTQFFLLTLFRCCFSRPLITLIILLPLPVLFSRSIFFSFFPHRTHPQSSFSKLEITTEEHPIFRSRFSTAVPIVAAAAVAACSALYILRPLARSALTLLHSCLLAARTGWYADCLHSTPTVSAVTIPRRQITVPLTTGLVIRLFLRTLPYHIPLPHARTYIYTHTYGRRVLHTHLHLRLTLTPTPTYAYRTHTHTRTHDTIEYYSHYQPSGFAARDRLPLHLIFAGQEEEEE